MLELESLNDKQREAVERIDGPLLVLAGAGSGKTRTLTYRIANILEQGRVSPHGVLAITFTRKAAWEMRRRLGELVGKQAEDITATTFHSLGFKLLSAEAGALGYKPDKLVVYDAVEAQRLLFRAMQEMNVNGTRWALETVAPITKVTSVIERAKDNLYSPEDFVRVKGDFFEESIAKVYRRYQQLLMENNAVDYGDLIRLAVQLLRQNPSTLEFYQNLFRYVSVDEFQDTSFAQYQLVRHLVWRNRNLCCVGSPVQAIYSWRGADIHNILDRFREDFNDAPMVVLSHNYRSTSTILDAAQAVVSDLPYHDAERLQSDNGEGAAVVIVPLNTDYDEANFIASEIKRFDDERFCGPEDCAVLFRTRTQGRLLEQVFMHLGLSYTLVGDFKFFERREVKDILAYLRLVHDMLDAGALQRIINRPPRGLGTAAIQKLQRGEPELNFDSISGLHRRDDLPPKVKEAAMAFADLLFDDLAMAVKEKPLPEFVDYVLEQTGYRAWVQKDPDAKRRLANLRLLRAMTTRYENTVTATNANLGDAREEALGTFLTDIATMSVVEGGDPDVGLPTEAKGVTMATIHAVKGLEFPVVFLAGLEEGIFPHAKAMKTAEGMEEETRLAYVAMTRAMSLLYLTYARSRVVGDEVKEHAPSRFLAAIPKHLIERRTATRESVLPMVVEETPLAIPIDEVQHAESG
ncbi:MAG: UvrD-helicase domain-containing protein [Chloroflexi bacterium]|nr:UvrD-helicase domain-containing protein [Chloroflexota bacterium]